MSSGPWLRTFPTSLLTARHLKSAAGRQPSRAISSARSAVVVGANHSLHDLGELYVVFTVPACSSPVIGGSCSLRSDRVISRRIFSLRWRKAIFLGIEQWAKKALLRCWLGETNIYRKAPSLKRAIRKPGRTLNNCNDLAGSALGSG